MVQLSYWEREHLLHYDVIIVGSGICGLSAACSILERDSRKRVLILERGWLPTGASTRNAGFACIGSITEKQSDLAIMGEEAFLRLIESRKQGLELLRKRLGDERIGYVQHGGYELLVNGRLVDQEAIAGMNRLLFPLFGRDLFSADPEAVQRFGFHARMISQVVLNNYEGQLNSGMMMNTLWDYATRLGARVITGAEVEGIAESGDKVQASLKEGPVFSAEQLILCTNAFTGRFLPEEEVLPGRGQVLLTSEIPGLKPRGVFSFDEGYYYFRNIHNRILFGGGRNLDFEGERSASFTLNPYIQQKLEQYLKEMILPGIPFSVEQRWTGIMAFGGNKQPLVRRVSDRILVGARLNGMGVALGSRVGMQLSELLYF